MQTQALKQQIAPAIIIVIACIYLLYFQITEGYSLSPEGLYQTVLPILVTLGFATYSSNNKIWLSLLIFFTLLPLISAIIAPHYYPHSMLSEAEIFMPLGAVAAVRGYKSVRSKIAKSLFALGSVFWWGLILLIIAGGIHYVVTT
jgi:hypothetical protein